MGITVKRLKFKEHRKAEKEVELDFLIDSGAVYSVVPWKILDQLNIDTYRTKDFSLADTSQYVHVVFGGSLPKQIQTSFYEENGGIIATNTIKLDS